MDQALQERLDRIEQRMDTFEEKLGQMDELATKASVDELAHHVREELTTKASVDELAHHVREELATKASVDELARQVQEECRNARIGAVHDMQVILENTVMKQLKLLAEGQQLLLETLAPKSRVEDLEEDVAMLKQVVRMMSQDIAELKKAQ